MRIAVYKKGHVYSHYPHTTHTYPYTYLHTRGSRTLTHMGCVYKKSIPKICLCQKFFVSL